MTPEEIKGSFYVWASPELQAPLGHLLGFSPADLKRHGRLQHLNEWESDFEAEDLAAEEAGLPDKALTYYREARAERVKLSALMRKEGKPEPEIAADDAIEREFMLEPLEHLRPGGDYWFVVVSGLNHLIPSIGVRHQLKLKQVKKRAGYSVYHLHKPE